MRDELRQFGDKFFLDNFMMLGMRRTVQEINEKLERGDALVLTAREVEELLCSGRESEVRQVDVVTTGTMGIMSGTYASLSFQICEAGIHRKFKSAKINGVPATVGPCPNESLGIIDVMVNGTEESEERPNYCGAFLFRDLVEGKEVTVEAVAKDGAAVEKRLTMSDMLTAKLLSSRNCFRNYRGFVNPSDEEFRSIFSCRPFPPNYGGLAFSGCGHLNPIQNDPELRTIGVGTKVLFNGTEGFVMSNGTRSSVKYPNLMTIADMDGMDPTLMGGFLTANGPECLSSYAMAIPILDDSVLGSIMTMDKDIPLSIGDIRDRHKIGQADYGQAWSGDEVIGESDEKCIRCDDCLPVTICPTSAIVRRDGEATIDRSRCVNCGACVAACANEHFHGRLGKVTAVVNGAERAMPIVCRGSNREGAIRTMKDLKRRILDGKFTMTAKVSDLKP
jgi:putative methanogenesis marker 16 metalloprotein